MIPYSGPIVTRAEAKGAGLKRFFPGEPCKNRHICQHYTLQGQCVGCNNAAFRQYRRENLDREKTRRRQYYAEHKEWELPRTKAYEAGRRANGTDYYTRNAEAIRAKKRLERQMNPEGVRERDRAIHQRYKATLNKAKRAWEKRHPDLREQKKRNRRAKELGAPGRHTAKQIKALYVKQHGKCAFCFKRLNGKYEIDHYVALARGGSNDISNIQLLCRPCNQTKHATDPIVFAQRNGRLL